MQATAKRLGTGRTRLILLMRDEGILLKDDLPRQKFIDAGHVKLVTGTYSDGNGSGARIRR